MKYSDFEQEVKEMEGPDKRFYDTLLKFTGRNGVADKDFADVMERSADAADLADRIFKDKDDFKTTAAWAHVAIHKVDDPILELKCELSKEFEPYPDNNLIIKMPEADVPIQMPTHVPITKMYVFKDGEWNRELGILKLTITGLHWFEGVELSGVYDVIYAGDAVVFEKWDVDSHGRRTSGIHIGDGYQERL